MNLTICCTLLLKKLSHKCVEKTAFSKKKKKISFRFKIRYRKGYTKLLFIFSKSVPQCVSERAETISLETTIYRLKRKTIVSKALSHYLTWILITKRTKRAILSWTTTLCHPIQSIRHRDKNHSTLCNLVGKEKLSVFYYSIRESSIRKLPLLSQEVQSYT